VKSMWYVNNFHAAKEIIRLKSLARIGYTFFVIGNIRERNVSRVVNAFYSRL